MDDLFGAQDTWKMASAVLVFILGGIVAEDLRDTFHCFFQHPLMKFVLITILLYCFTGNLVLSVVLGCIILGVRHLVKETDLLVARNKEECEGQDGDAR